MTDTDAPTPEMVCRVCGKPTTADEFVSLPIGRMWAHFECMLAIVATDEKAFDDFKHGLTQEESIRALEKCRPTLTNLAEVILTDKFARRYPDVPIETVRQFVREEFCTAAAAAGDVTAAKPENPK